MTGERTTGNITWSTNGEAVASISIEVQAKDPPHIVFDYAYNGKPIRYVIPLQWFPSNLRRGRIWYFLCTKSHKRCRNLVLFGGMFVHRSAICNGMYKCQTYSHGTRRIRKTFNAMAAIDEVDTAVCSRYFKQFYRGKETRKYKRLIQRLSKAESLNIESLISILQ